MNSRAFTLSLVIAGIAMFMVWSYLDGMESQFIQKYGKPVPVVVAKQDIKELDILDDRVLQIKNVPEEFVQPGAFSKIEDVYNTYAAVPFLKNEQVTKTRVTQPGARTGLAHQVSVGKRALALRVTEETAVANLLRPGDRVDIITVIDYAGGKKDMMEVKTVLQDVLILSTGLKVTNALPLVTIKGSTETKQRNLSTYTNFNTVTLELTPFEIQKVILLSSMGGRLRLSLRNNDDKNIERISRTRLFDVLGEDAAEAKAYFAEQYSRSRRGR